ncbi:MAG: protein kinase, partial [Acidobacteria bacterium]|nr:protein kinase [Acidobacteriota bacterium]
RERLSRAGRLAPDDAACILHGVLAGLAAAHAEGVVHRDVKPGNIFLARLPDGGERVVLLDFGLARGSGEDALTHTGQFLGTPEYVSPEQARGERDVGTASDVYSAGIVLWEMLAGAPPFAGDSAVEILNAHASHPVPSPRRFLAAAPAYLRDLAAWMLAKDARSRPPIPVALECLARRRRKYVGARLRRALARRPSRIGAAVLLATAAAVAFVPMRPTIDDEQPGRVIVRSLAGLPVRSRAFDFAIAGMAPADPTAWWPRDQLVLLGNSTSGSYEPYPKGLETGLLRLDTLSGRVSPFPPLVVVPRGGGFFPKFDGLFRGTRLVTLPRDIASGGPLFALAYHHAAYPSLIALASNRVGRAAPHPGWITAIELIEPAGPGQPPLLLGVAENHDLGQRPVFFGLPINAVRPDEFAFTFPPHELFVPTSRPAAYYTFLPEGRFADLRVSGRRAEIVLDGGKSLVLDADTGVPLRADDRDGLAADVWETRQRELLQLLQEAGRSSMGAEVETETAAGQLEAFAQRTPIATTQRGVALARAAVLQRRIGDLPHALRLAEQALDLEPGVMGHHRLVIHLLTLQGRWSDAGSTLQNASSASTQHEVIQDLTLATLIDGRDAELKAQLAASGPGFWFLYLARAYLALNRGDGDGAARELDTVVRFNLDPTNPLRDPRHVPFDAYSPELAFLRGLAEALRPGPDLALAERFLDKAEAGKGAGQTLPFHSLRAYLDVLAGKPPRGLDQLEPELQAQHDAARENLVDLYFVPWGEALAARACAAAGDHGRAERHSQLARLQRGGSAYLDRVLSTRGAGRGM